MSKVNFNMVPDQVFSFQLCEHLLATAPEVINAANATSTNIRQLDMNQISPVIRNGLANLSAACTEVVRNCTAGQAPLERIADELNNHDNFGSRINYQPSNGMRLATADDRRLVDRAGVAGRLHEDDMDFLLDRDDNPIVIADFDTVWLTAMRTDPAVFNNIFRCMTQIGEDVYYYGQLMIEFENFRNAIFQHSTDIQGLINTCENDIKQLNNLLNYQHQDLLTRFYGQASDLIRRLDHTLDDLSQTMHNDVQRFRQEANARVAANDAANPARPDNRSNDNKSWVRSQVDKGIDYILPPQVKRNEDGRQVTDEQGHPILLTEGEYKKQQQEKADSKIHREINKKHVAIAAGGVLALLAVAALGKKLYNKYIRDPRKYKKSQEKLKVLEEKLAELNAKKDEIAASDDYKLKVEWNNQLESIVKEKIELEREINKLEKTDRK